MASVMDREVFRVDRLWREEGEEPWLVSFYVTELEGRMECVGFALRSFLALKETPDSEHHGPSWTWCPLPIEGLERPLLITDLETLPTPNECHVRLKESDDEWPALIVDAERELGKPMPLSATRVRALPFGQLLSLATRDRAIWTRWLLDTVEKSKTDPSAHWAADAREQPDVAADLEVSLVEMAQQAIAIESLRSGRLRAREDGVLSLERVAKLYEHFYREGSSSPTRDVAEALRMSRSTTAKRVMECRKAGLLAPTSRGRAGGMRGREGAKP